MDTMPIQRNAWISFEAWIFPRPIQLQVRLLENLVQRVHGLVERVLEVVVLLLVERFERDFRGLRGFEKAAGAHGFKAPKT